MTSVNLSGEQLKHPDLRDDVTRILDETGVDPGLLKFEITESILMEHVESAINEIARLRDLGIEFYIDDFGTGYSSLSYLRRFNVEKLKIDRSFISRLEGRGKDLELVRNIVRVAHGLQMAVVAEGVETLFQLEQVKAIGCDYGQGFDFSKPVDVKAAEALVMRT